MEASLFMLLGVGLLMLAGIVISVHLYRQEAPRTDRFRRIRRVRLLRPQPGNPVIEETIEEVIDEEAPV